jgi:hypothetical protein
MKRRRFKHDQSFSERCLQEAERLREQARQLPPGPERQELERKARQTATAAHIEGWLQSPGLQPPK